MFETLFLVLLLDFSCALGTILLSQNDRYETRSMQSDDYHKTANQTEAAVTTLSETQIRLWKRWRVEKATLLFIAFFSRRVIYCLCKQYMRSRCNDFVVARSPSPQLAVGGPEARKPAFVVGSERRMSNYVDAGYEYSECCGRCFDTQAFKETGRNSQMRRGNISRWCC